MNLRNKITEIIQSCRSLDEDFDLNFDNTTAIKDCTNVCIHSQVENLIELKNLIKDEEAKKIIREKILKLHNEIIS